MCVCINDFVCHIVWFKVDVGSGTFVCDGEQVVGINHPGKYCRVG